jgi:putative hemolysin
VWGIELAVMLVMIALNAVFAGYEIALASVSVARLEALARENRAGAKASLRMKRGMERSLAVVQLGMTLCGAIAAATGGAGADRQIVPLLGNAGVSPALVDTLAIAIVAVPLTLVTIIFGELIPKVFSLRNKEWVCLRLSPLMSWLAASLWPVVWLVETPVMLILRWSERRWRPGSQAQGKGEAAELQELRAVAALARTSKLIGAQEESIIVSAARLSSRHVRESMLPAQYISMIEADSTLEEALIAGHLDLHTRFPVAEREGDPQSISGYVNFKDIVACMRVAGHNPSLQSVVRPIPSVQEDLTLSSCLEQLIREHTHIALVRGRSNKIVGMITLEDIIEELVGEIQDEFDRLPGHVKPSGTSWVVGGGVGLPKLKEATGIQLSGDGDASPKTLSDWVTGRLGGPVRGGESVRQGDVTVIVRSVRRQHVHEAQVLRQAGS